MKMDFQTLKTKNLTESKVAESKRIEERVSKRGIMTVLTDAFNGKEPSRNQLLTTIKTKSNKIWTGMSTDQTNDKCDRLLLELMVAGIVSYKFDVAEVAEESKKDDCKRHGIGDGSKCDRNLKFKSNSESYHAPEAWLKIPHLRQDCDIAVVAAY